MVDDSELIIQAKQGYNSAKAELLKLHTGLIRRIIRRYCKDPQNVDDYYQVASLAFLGAILTFDPGLGVKFSTYFALAINHKLQRYRTRDRIVVNPQWQQQKRLVARREALGPFDGTEADSERAELDTAIASHGARVASLDEPLETVDEFEITRLDFLADGAPLADVEFETQERRCQAAVLLSELPEWRRDILLRGGRTLASIGEERGVSRERIRQIEAKGIGAIRKQARTSLYP